MTDHEHEWGEPGKNEAGDLHDYAVCQICRRVMYRTEVYAILNEHAKLKRVRDAAVDYIDCIDRQLADEHEGLGLLRDALAEEE